MARKPYFMGISVPKTVGRDEPVDDLLAPQNGGDDASIVTFKVPVNEMLYFWFEDNAFPSRVRIHNNGDTSDDDDDLDKLATVTVDSEEETVCVSTAATSISIPLKTVWYTGMLEEMQNLLDVDMVTGKCRTFLSSFSSTSVERLRANDVRVVVNTDQFSRPQCRIRATLATSGAVQWKTILTLSRPIVRVAIEDECVFDPETQTLLYVDRPHGDRTHRLRTTLYVPASLLEDSDTVDPWFNSTLYIDLRRSQCLSAGLEGGMYKKFETREEFRTTMVSIRDEKTLQAACNTYGPFSTWDISAIDNLESLFMPNAINGDETRKRLKEAIKVVSNLNIDDKFSDVLDLSSWNFSKRITSTLQMFAGCDTLRSILLPYSLSMVTERSRAYNSSWPCETLHMEHMFDGCSSLTHVSRVSVKVRCATQQRDDGDQSQRKFVASLGYMFANCPLLKTASISTVIHANTAVKLKSLEFLYDGTFRGCRALETIHVGCDVDPSTLTESVHALHDRVSFKCYKTFEDCVRLGYRRDKRALYCMGNLLKTEEREFKTVHVLPVADAEYMFFNCHRLGSIDDVILKVSGRTSFMFANCFAITDQYIQRFFDDNPLTEEQSSIVGMFATTKEFSRVRSPNVPAAKPKHRAISLSFKVDRPLTFSCIESVLALMFFEDRFSSPREIFVPWSVSCTSANDVDHDVFDTRTQQLVPLTSKDSYLIQPCLCDITDKTTYWTQQATSN